MKLVLTINILILYLKQHRTLRMYRIKQITLYIDLPTRPFSPLLEYVRNLIISSQKMIQKSNSNWFDQIFSKRCSKCQSEFNKINFEHSYWSETIGFEKLYQEKLRPVRNDTKKRKGNFRLEHTHTIHKHTWPLSYYLGRENRCKESNIILLFCLFKHLCI